MPPETEAIEAPETESPATESNEVAPVGTSDTPSTENASENGHAPDYELPFSWDDVPEDAREHVERWVKSAKGDYTRKTQALADTRRELAEKSDLFNALEDESTVEDAFNRLAEMYGMEAAQEALESEYEDDEYEEGEAEEDNSEIAELRSEIEELKGSEGERVRDRQKQIVTDAVLQGLNSYAESKGIKELDDDVGSAITLMAMSMAPLHSGLPDMESAVEAWESAEQVAIESYVASKRGNAPDTSGGSGVTELDMSDPLQRRQHMEAIAARHLDGANS